MENKSFTETISERVSAVEQVVDSIVQGGRAEDLRDLRILLVNTMSLLTRDPGVEAAVDDLYAAALAIVRDAAAGAHPVSRNVRFLRSALARFATRVPSVSSLMEAEDAMRFKGLEAAYAVQLERTSSSEEESEKAEAEEAQTEEAERSAA